MEKNNIKGLKILAWAVIVLGLWSIFSWTRLLLSPEKMITHIDIMNKMGTVFTPLSFKINRIGIMTIMLIAIVSGILVLKQKEVGRKVLIFTLIAGPSYYLIWVMINLILGRKIGLFIFNIVVGIPLCYFIIKYLTRPKVKEQFKR